MNLHPKVAKVCSESIEFIGITASGAVPGTIAEALIRGIPIILNGYIPGHACFELRANVLGRQNAAIECQTNLLNRKEYAEKRAKSLEQRTDSIADALRRADALRQCILDA
ncbi:hypothetical protein Tco_1051264 [Tanacetum coccineum]